MNKVSINSVQWMAICASVIILLASCNRDNRPTSAVTTPPEELTEVIVANPVELSNIRLTNHNDKPVTEKFFDGKWTFMFFGYTQCPDVCPTTMMELDDLSKLLSQSANNPDVQYVFVTIDPEHDKVKNIAGFINYFNKSFVAITGSLDEIGRLALQADIFHSREKLTDINFIVDHSSAVVLIDPSKRYFARFEAPHYAREMQSLFEKVKNYYSETHS